MADSHREIFPFFFFFFLVFMTFKIFSLISVTSKTDRALQILRPSHDHAIGLNLKIHLENDEPLAFCLEHHMRPQHLLKSCTLSPYVYWINQTRLICIFFAQPTNRLLRRKCCPTSSLFRSEMRLTNKCNILRK